MRLPLLSFLSAAALLSGCAISARCMASGFVLLTGAMPPAADAPVFGFQDFLLVPVRVHLLSSKDTPALHTTMTGGDVERILLKVNGVWAPAGIQFFMESLVCEAAETAKKNEEPDPTKRAPAGLPAMLDHMPAASRCGEAFNIYYIKSFDVNGVYFRNPEAVFVKDTASLRKVEGGIDEPLPRVTAHELGHAFSLVHRQDTFNLMASGTTGTSLNEAEIRQARESAAKRTWILPAKTWQEKAEALEKDGKGAEALTVYQKLAALPLEAAPEVQAARAKSKAAAKPAAPTAQDHWEWRVTAAICNHCQRRILKTIGRIGLRHAKKWRLSPPLVSPVQKSAVGADRRGTSRNTRSGPRRILQSGGHGIVRISADCERSEHAAKQTAP